MHIIGTAGHVDHGKSSLVIALTGHNPDRFIEERERGMTLDLGFAPLRFDDGVEAGIVDVPGHERFLHNMLAGAAGMELLLLVVDATEGPRPQTFEHLHILDFLNVRRAIIVLTKRDLVGPDEIEIAGALTTQACAQTVASDAPVIAVSNTTGEGIDELKRAIHAALVALPPRDPAAPAYLPVDRVFALPGHGTIVTGTLMQGTIKTGDTLALQPSGLQARVRSIQVFGRKVDSVSGGSRAALNLPGVGVSDIHRGEALVATLEFQPTRELAIDFTALPGALKLLKRRTPVRAHIGSAEIPGTLIFESGAPSGTQPARAKLSLSRAAVFYPGSRLVLRRMSPKDLLGGAAALSTAASAATSAGTSEEDASPVLRALRATDLQPLDLAKIAAAANVVLDSARVEIERLIEEGAAVALHKPVAYLTRAAFDSAFARLAAALACVHKERPWRSGATAQELARSLGIDLALGARLLDAYLEDGRVAQSGRFWHLPDFKTVLTREQQAFFGGAVGLDPANPLVPHSHESLTEQIAASKVSGLDEALESLLAIGALVRVGDDLYRREQIGRARTLLEQTLARGASATMAQVRDAFGTSRKYALPLMEYFDGIGLTIRDGDLRRLRAGANRA
jgi:selenocysteine-specific elongation factor